MRAQEEVGGEIVHGFERAFRHDHPAQSPASHAEELGEAGTYDASGSQASTDFTSEPSGSRSARSR